VYVPLNLGKNRSDSFDKPGRFIVSYLLKALMAHILLNYDVKLVGDGQRPADIWLGYTCSPNRSAK
jgi:hypothetical protein